MPNFSVCPKCNYLIVDPSLPCPSCGAEIDIPASAVPPPTVEARADSEKIYRGQIQSGDKDSGTIRIGQYDISKRIIAVVSVLCAVILLICGGGFYYYNKWEEAKINEYVGNMRTTARLMIEGAIFCDMLTDGVIRVWNMSIDNDWDFNEEIAVFYEGMKDRIDNIGDNQNAVKEAMSKLNNPPNMYQSAYDTLSEMYKTYVAISNMTIDPSGSLRTYSDTKRTLIAEFMQHTNLLETRFPNVGE